MPNSRWRLGCGLVSLLAAVIAAAASADAGVTSEYRRKFEATADMPLDADVFRLPPGFNAVQQVQMTLGDQKGTAMIVSWVTEKSPGSTTVRYGNSRGTLDLVERSTYTRYTYNKTYTSGFIHQCTLGNLMHGTKYHYAIGYGKGQRVRRFSFTTPPKPGPDVPFRFGIIGDLGQTSDSNTTLSHYDDNGGAAVLYLGDLAYADAYAPNDQNRWDTWGRFVERSAAVRPWLWTVGNHEEEPDPITGDKFKPFTRRCPTPYRAAGSTHPFWYSVKLASAHVVVLSTYSNFTAGSSQWAWLKAELRRVDRSTTPWLIVLMHKPWYNSNKAHQGDEEGGGMREQFERWLLEARADLVLAGHVHAYERFQRVFDGRRNSSAPAYVNVGDGGNVNGIAGEWEEPQPSYSAFREASFGHAILDIKNRTHAYCAWHRNQDGAKVVAEGVWFTNRYWKTAGDDD
ncbi:hypothetical protein ACP4OV_013020 [Aristida adscensionis]